MIVYILLCGFPPFYGDNDAQMFKRIKAGHYKFLSPYWDPISADAKDFVRNLLVVRSRKNCIRYFVEAMEPNSCWPTTCISLTSHAYAFSLLSG